MTTSQPPTGKLTEDERTLLQREEADDILTDLSHEHERFSPHPAPLPPQPLNAIEKFFIGAITVFGVYVLAQICWLALGPLLRHWQP